MGNCDHLYYSDSLCRSGRDRRTETNCKSIRNCSSVYGGIVRGVCSDHYDHTYYRNPGSDRNDCEICIYRKCTGRRRDGTMVVAMQKGIARGIFSNEAGLGSAPIAAAAAVTKEPVRQGLVSMTGTFIDTIIICTMTGISVVLAGTWNDPNLEGVEITMAAFQKGLPFASAVASFILMLCLVFFAFTTILGWNYYGERCMEYLFNRNKKVVMTYRWLYILAVFIGPYMTVAAVWNIADIFNALMALPNLIALLVLSNVVVKETKDYFARMK